jgi:hypothetical protein
MLHTVMHKGLCPKRQKILLLSILRLQLTFPQEHDGIVLGRHLFMFGLQYRVHVEEREVIPAAETFRNFGCRVNLRHDGHAEVHVLQDSSL